MTVKNEDYEGYDQENHIKRKKDANNSWWVSELLAADCWQAWLHEGLDDTMQKWHDLKKKDEAKLEEMHQRKVSQMILCADGHAGLLH